MKIYKKQKSGGNFDNKGCCITSNSQGRLGFNFSPEVCQALTEYVEFWDDERNRLYFKPSNEQNGYKISIKLGGNGTGRFALTLTKKNREAIRFVGNHTVKRGKDGMFIEI